LNQSNLTKWLPAVAWAGVISWTSSYVVTVRQLTSFVQTHSPVATVREGFPTYWAATWFVTVKGWHVLEFAILTFLIRRALPGKALWMVASLALGFAIADEIHQTFVPERYGTVMDVGIDSIGVLAATLLLRRRERQRFEG